jgi:hypothetical protein
MRTAKDADGKEEKPVISIPEKIKLRKETVEQYSG